MLSYFLSDQEDNLEFERRERDQVCWELAWRVYTTCKIMSNRQKIQEATMSQDVDVMEEWLGHGNDRCANIKTWGGFPVPT